MDKKSNSCKIRNNLAETSFIESLLYVIFLSFNKEI